MAGKIYNIELTLRPIDLHLEITFIKTVLRRMASSRFRDNMRPHNSLLTKLVVKIEAFIGKPISSLELKKPYTNAPRASLLFAVVVKDFLKVLIEHERLLVDESALIFYTDGSGIDDHIGAVRRRYLGKALDYIVYNAELMGIILALNIAIDVQNGYPDLPVRIYTDNQAAIESSGTLKAGSCQFQLDRILELHSQLHNRLSIHWIPAHVGVPGNEAADREAKTAAQTVPRTPSEYPSLLGLIFNAFKQMADTKWGERWGKHKHGVYLRRIQPKRDLKAMNKFNGMTRSLCALLVQIRTGEIGFNDFFYPVDKAETDRCSCAEHLKQTAEHVLTTCLRWAELREHKLWQGTGNRDLTSFLRKPRTARRAAIFMARTGLLGELGKACLDGLEE